MSVTVIVPTYRRPESLGRCLDALARQELPADEILVVVRQTDAASREVASHRGDRVRVVDVLRPGVVAALNAGIDASSGVVVALTDDDAEPHPDWIKRLAAAYAGDPAIGAVGGRDWVFHDGRLEHGAQQIVGTMRGWGAIAGGHHLGTGPAREVDVLKGVNLSMRGALLREIRVDARLRGTGTEHHWEMGLCLAARRRGYRVIYDPAIAVDHRPQPRIDDSRDHGPGQTRHASHNATLAILEHLPAWRRPLYAAWSVGFGTRTAPGLAQLARALVVRRELPGSLFAGAQAGLALGAITFARSRRDRRLSARR